MYHLQLARISAGGVELLPDHIQIVLPCSDENPGSQILRRRYGSAWIRLSNEEILLWRHRSSSSMTSSTISTEAKRLRCDSRTASGSPSSLPLRPVRKRLISSIVVRRGGAARTGDFRLTSIRHVASEEIEAAAELNFQQWRLWWRPGVGFWSATRKRRHRVSLDPGGAAPWRARDATYGRRCGCAGRARFGSA